MTSPDANLGPGVRLIGEFTGSAFKDRQWLIERDGHFIQVSELLYRVAEYADGERTVPEIASLLTTSTDWITTAEHVRTIITAKLIPLAIIQPTIDGGSVKPAVRPPPSSVRAASESTPLAAQSIAWPQTPRHSCIATRCSPPSTRRTGMRAILTRSSQRTRPG